MLFAPGSTKLIHFDPVKRAFATDEPELMDLPQPITAELEKDLANLASLNRYFGSHRLIRHFLARWLKPGAVYRILDLATGAGDVPRLIAIWAREQGISVTVVAVDANAATVEIARRQSTALPEIEWVHADALRFTPGESFDIACCSLALHHFSTEDAVRLLRQCRKLSHGGVLVADLERSRLAQFGIWLVTQFVYREPMTRFDGRLSIRRAFSGDEFRTLAEAAGWNGFGYRRFLWYRQAIWLETPGGDGLKNKKRGDF